MTARFDTRRWARWAGSFIGFPLAGLAAKAVAGPIDSTTAALLGGAAAGATLGAVQALALRADTRIRGRWIAGTAVGMATGLAVGATAVDFAFDTASLVTMGAVTGAAIGVAQAAVLPASSGRRSVWAITSSAVWALGWLITSQVIVDTDARWANFGATGALVATMIGGLVLAVRAQPTDRHDTVVPTAARPIASSCSAVQ
jgi:hypothetical protein